MADINNIQPLAAIRSQDQLLSSVSVNEGSLRRGLQGLNDREEAEALAKQMERIFMDMVVTAMRKTVPEGGLFEEAAGETKTFTQMLDREYTGLASEFWEFGFHEALVRQIIDPAGGGAELPDTKADLAAQAIRSTALEGSI